MDLLNEWNNMNKEVIINSDAELAKDVQFIKTESTGVLSTLKKHIRAKLMWGRLISVPILVASVFVAPPAKYWFLAIFVIYELLRFLMLRQLKGINYEGNYTETTKEVLTEQLEIIRKTLTIERIWGYLVLPFACPVGFVLPKLIKGNSFASLLDSPATLYIILALMLVGIPLMYLAERANKFAFGKYIDKLTAHLKDMESSV